MSLSLAPANSAKVYLIARPQLDWDELDNYLESIEAPELGRSLQDAQALVEVAGRLCYRSWEPGMNENVTKIRTDKEAYFGNILHSGHGSVLEHANFSFLFQDVSRIFTHELVRHRAGSAFSQESLRFVKRGQKIRVAHELEEDELQLEEHVKNLNELLGYLEGKINGKFDMSFAQKKKITSAIRRLVPDGVLTDILWTANLRTLRLVVEKRTAEGAEEELREVFDKVAWIMNGEVPHLWQDFARTTNGEWIPENKKI